MDGLRYANALSLQEGYAPCFVIDDSGDDPVVSLNGVSTVYECEGYRLPTEAEWEYAAKAGTDSGLYTGQEADAIDCLETSPNADPIAWTCHNSSDTIHPVKGKIPNNWDLYDMLGNVKEWVWDYWEVPPVGSVDPYGGLAPETEIFRVLKGGSYTNPSRDCRSATRGRSDSTDDNQGRYGFRIARTL